MRRVALLLLLAPMLVESATLTATPATLETQLARMRPGDRLLLAGGQYPLLRCEKLCAPQTTLQAVPGAEVIFRGLHFVGTQNQHITMRGVIVDGAKKTREGVSIVSGARAITIEDSEIRNATAHGVLTGADSNVFRRVYVHDNGTRPHFDHGLYLVGPNNRVEDSRIAHNIGYGVHIYDAGKGTARGNVVSGNLIEHNGWGGPTAYGLTMPAGNREFANVYRGNHSGAKIIGGVPFREQGGTWQAPALGPGDDTVPPPGDPPQTSLDFVPPTLPDGLLPVVPPRTVTLPLAPVGRRVPRTGG